MQQMLWKTREIYHRKSQDSMEGFSYHNLEDYRTCLYVVWNDPMQGKTLAVSTEVRVNYENKVLGKVRVSGI